MRQPPSGSVILFRKLWLDVLNGFAPPRRQFEGAVVAEDRFDDCLSLIYQGREGKPLDGEWCWRFRIGFEWDVAGRPSKDQVDVAIELGKSPKGRDLIVAALLQRALGADGPERIAAETLATQFYGRRMQLETKGSGSSEAERFIERVLAAVPREPPGPRRTPLEAVELHYGPKSSQSVGSGAEPEANATLQAWRPGMRPEDRMRIRVQLSTMEPCFSIVNPYFDPEADVRTLVAERFRERARFDQLNPGHTAVLLYLADRLEGKPTQVPTPREPTFPLVACPACMIPVRWHQARFAGFPVFVVEPHLRGPNGSAGFRLCRHVVRACEDLDLAVPCPLESQAATSHTCASLDEFWDLILQAAQDRAKKEGPR